MKQDNDPVMNTINWLSRTFPGMLTAMITAFLAGILLMALATLWGHY